MISAKGNAGPVVKVPKGKEQIAIWLDSDVVNWFHYQVDLSSGGNYQTLINDALHEYIDGKAPKLEETLRRVIREEMATRLA